MAGQCWGLQHAAGGSLPTSPVRFGLLSAGVWIAVHGGFNLHSSCWPGTLS